MIFLLQPTTQTSQDLFSMECLLYHTQRNPVFSLPLSIPIIPTIMRNYDGLLTEFSENIHGNLKHVFFQEHVRAPPASVLPDI